MQQRIFGRLGDLSALTLGGGGIGQVWGPTTRDEAMATVRAAWEAGITWFDVAPSYGPGEAEVVLGEACGGRLPPGVRVSTKCAVGNRAAREVLPLLERSLDESLARMRLDRVDLFFVHNQIVPDASADQIPGTPHRLFVEAVRPAFEQLVARGRIGAWGITGIGVPTTIIATLNEDPAPAAVQVVTNLLDSPGAMQRDDESPPAAGDHRGGPPVRHRRHGDSGGAGGRADRCLGSGGARGPPGEAGPPAQCPFPCPGARACRVTSVPGASLRAVHGGGGHGRLRGEEP